MEYEYPTLIVDDELKRLHVAFDRRPPPDPALIERRKKCDFAEDGQTVMTSSFMEAVRLINEEAYRPCGNCLEEGGEVSNWKERAEQAEEKVEDLTRRNEANLQDLYELRERMGLEKAPKKS